jgi:acyl carrier protein
VTVDRPPVLDTIIVIVSEQSGAPVTADTKLDSLGLDSLDLLSICQAAEEELHLDFEMDYDPATMITVQDIADYINRHGDATSGGIQ